MTQLAPLVLIAEDDPDDQMMIKKALVETGFEGDIDFCEDGHQVIARLESRPAQPILVLLDLEMPRMGGLEALAILRNEKRDRTVPVVVVTSSELPSDVKMAYDLGANAYLRKPRRLADLRMAMESIRRFWFEVATLPRGKPA